ncbi:hypothetical protein BVRB_6g136410 [Beta vulgaris subsp. vulgaris]|nr:hypothetical protein BVRB_6g136410 [Beta vulgaris subsp. vulgaris]
MEPRSQRQTGREERRRNFDIPVDFWRVCLGEHLDFRCPPPREPTSPRKLQPKINRLKKRDGSTQNPQGWKC